VSHAPIPGFGYFVFAVMGASFLLTALAIGIIIFWQNRGKK